MKYIDENRLKSLTAKDFQNAYPFPWINPRGFLTAEGFATLQATYRSRNV